MFVFNPIWRKRGKNMLALQKGMDLQNTKTCFTLLLLFLVIIINNNSLCVESKKPIRTKWTLTDKGSHKFPVWNTPISVTKSGVEVRCQQLLQM